MGIFCDGFQNIVTKFFNISIKFFLNIDVVSEEIDISINQVLNKEWYNLHHSIVMFLVYSFPFY